MNAPSGFCLAILLTLFSTLCQQAPAFSRQYELGALYSFNYEASALLNDAQAKPIPSPKNVGFKVDLQVNVAPVWQHPSNANEQIMEMKVTSPKLSVRSRQKSPSPDGFMSKTSKAEKMETHPFFLHREGGVIRNVFYVSKESLSWLNIKKGIASLFQYQPRDETKLELDTSGECEVIYRMKGKQLLQKLKNNCKTMTSVPFFNHTNKVLSAEISSQSETTFELDPEDGSIKSCSSVESHVLRPQARTSSGVEVIGKQVLHFKGKTTSKAKTFNGKTSSEVVNKIAKKIGRALMAEKLPTTPDPKECIACKSLKDLVHNFRKALGPSSLATQSSAIAFLRLLGKVRDSDEKTIKTVLKDKKNAKILPQLLDIVAAAQTIPAHNAAKSVLDFGKKQLGLEERYLLSLSVTTHPLEYIIEDLLKTHRKGVTNPHLSETLALTIASLTRTYSKHTKTANQNVISNVRQTFLNNLDDCKDENCIMKFIRTLRNLQNKSTVTTLLKYAKKSNKKQAISAMRALQTMPQDFITAEVYKEIEFLFFELDSMHDSSVRAMAAEILLRWKPKSSFLRDLFIHFGCQNQGQKELNTLILGHIQDLCEKNKDMNKLVRKVLTENNLTNYHILGQGGLSSAFSRPLIEKAVINASFTNMLEINGGILKRSNVDVFVDVGDERMRLLSFGMFAGGLSMFAGDDSQATEEEEEANAGIEIALMDNQLRPFVFFRGQGELMGHVWAGTASERTTALQGSVLLQDHSQTVPLQNGLNVELLLTGVLSYDMAGQVQISLWNRNAHSLVEVGAAVVLQGQARVDNSFVQTMVEFNVGSQTQLNFVSDLDFSDDITMCLQMVQPNFNIIDNVRKFERIPGTNYVLRKYKKKSSEIPGKTYVMNKKNTELCNKMFRK